MLPESHRLILPHPAFMSLRLALVSVTFPRYLYSHTFWNSVLRRSITTCSPLGTTEQSERLPNCVRVHHGDVLVSNPCAYSLRLHRVRLNICLLSALSFGKKKYDVGQCLVLRDLRNDTVDSSIFTFKELQYPCLKGES